MSCAYSYEYQEYTNDELDDIYDGEWLDDDTRAQKEHLEDYYNEYPEYRYKSPFDEESDDEDESLYYYIPTQQHEENIIRRASH